MAIKDNGPEPTDPKWGKIWLNDHGQQRLADMVAGGTSKATAMQQLCAASAVETAIYAASHSPRHSVEALEKHIASYCPPRTKVQIEADGIRINGKTIGYIKHPVKDGLTKAAYAVLEAALVTEVAA